MEHMCVMFAVFLNEFNSQLENAKFDTTQKHLKIKLLENVIKIFETERLYWARKRAAILSTFTIVNEVGILEYTNIPTSFTMVNTIINGSLCERNSIPARITSRYSLSGCLSFPRSLTSFRNIASYSYIRKRTSNPCNLVNVSL